MQIAFQKPREYFFLILSIPLTSILFLFFRDDFKTTNMVLKICVTTENEKEFKEDNQNILQIKPRIRTSKIQEVSAMCNYESNCYFNVLYLFQRNSVLYTEIQRL